ncbi:class I SAM-dependent methyltransferase [Prauserella endophytica]|uniref:hypothetical protein n=1 Tax=Prauserella endophytica TaxID=1592324 RepID=UPI00197E0777|nr:hypothetical protein [Prauserella endophytica]
MGDVCEIAQPDEGVDPAVDFGSIHHAPDGHAAIAEIGRTLPPGALLLFEEVPRRMLNAWAMRTLTTHPRGSRFEAAEFAE